MQQLTNKSVFRYRIKQSDVIVPMRWHVRRRILLLLLVIALSNVFFYYVFLADSDQNYASKATTERPHELCVIVPYRDRSEELSEFAPYIYKFLTDQNIPFTILVMVQIDNYRFNRASLINVGWMEADRIGCDYMVMHDVDLLPNNKMIPYSYPGKGIVRHISSPEYHPKYKYAKFIGGILMLTMQDFKNINGMSNKYWGWGMEDDEFYLRIKDGGLNLTRVSGLSSDRSNSFRHIHGPKRKRDYAVVSKNQKDMKRKRDKVSGLSNLAYNISSRELTYYGEALVRRVNVELFCDKKWTPYCVSPKNVIIKREEKKNAWVHV